MIELANGELLYPILPLSYKETIQGQQREIFEFHFICDDTGENGYKWEDIRVYYKDPSPFNDIIFYEDSLDENGNKIFLSEHLHFIIPVSFNEKSIDGQNRLILKLAQMSEIEIVQKEQGDVLTALLQGV